MKDKNGIKICCENCLNKMLLVNTPGDCALCPNLEFVPSPEAYKSRIAELQEHNDILQKRIAELSMELLDYNMRDNKDVLERLKNWEE